MPSASWEKQWNHIISSQSRLGSAIGRFSTMGLRIVFILVAAGIVQSELLESCSDTMKFVDGHNSRRLQLANGEVPGQPGASQMTYVIWDEELATKAKGWAAGNKYGHNSDRTIPSKRFTVGENVYIYGTTSKTPQFDPDMALQGWWNEYKDYTYGPLSVDDFNGPQIGHYTQMAWDKSTRIGCGISKYHEDDWTKFLVVCNYGPTGNFLGDRPYNSDQGASGQLKCGESDCNEMYGDQCPYT